MITTTRETGNGCMGRLDGLLRWWGIDGPSSSNAAAARLQDFAARLQEIYADSYRRQMNAMIAANDRMSEGLKGLLRSRSPDEAIEAEIALLKAIAEDTSAQYATYVELMQQLSTCLNASVEDARSQASSATEEAHEREVAAPVRRPHGASGRIARHVSAA